MVNSLVWSAEEAKYLKAIFRWQETPTSPDEERRRRQAEEDERRQQEQTPVGEFRVLVIGGRGTGKTAILTRFGQDTFHGESQPPDPFYERGCRRPIALEVTPPPTLLSTSQTTTLPPTTATPTQTSGRSKSHPTPPKPTQTPQKQTYILDALEMPSPHLLSNPLLAQALSLTEAAVLIYSVRDAASFRLAQGLAEFMREHFSPIHPSVLSPVFSGSQNGAIGVGGVDKGRVYPVVLVGTKVDVPSPVADDDDGTLQDGGWEERAVSWAEGAKAAAGMGMPGSGADVPFLEVSAKTGEGVDKVFEVAAQEVLRVRRVVRERRERAQRERLMAEVGSVQTADGEGRRKRFWLWKALFGRRGPVGEGR